MHCLSERKERLRALLSGTGSPLHYSDHQIGSGQAFYDHACALKVEGIVLEAGRRALHARQSRPVAENQMFEP
jgi:ATP-dependent DNA ligase